LTQTRSPMCSVDTVLSSLLTTEPALLLTASDVHHPPRHIHTHSLRCTSSTTSQTHTQPQMSIIHHITDTHTASDVHHPPHHRHTHSLRCTSSPTSQTHTQPQMYIIHQVTYIETTEHSLFQWIQKVYYPTSTSFTAQKYVCDYHW